MNKQASTMDWRRNHLCEFICTDDTELARLLTPVEEFDCNDGFVIVDDCNKPDITGWSPLDSFHPEAVRMVMKDDDYYLGRRANHFILIFGQSETLEVDNNWGDCVVCIANHKSLLCVTLFAFKDDMEDPDA